MLLEGLQDARYRVLGHRQVAQVDAFQILLVELGESADVEALTRGLDRLGVLGGVDHRYADDTLGLLFPERDPNNPDIPTLKEAGVEFTSVFTPMVVMAPKDTPDANVAALDAACKKISEHKAFVKLMAKAGLPVKYLSGPDATAKYNELIASWKPLVDDLKGK